MAVSGVEDLAEARARFRVDPSSPWRTKLLIGATAPWRLRLLVGATKEPRALLANALLALREAPEWEGVLAYDEFSLSVVTKRPPPWVRTNGIWVGRPWEDRDDILAAEWLQHQGIHVNERVAGSAAVAVSKDASFHPVRDYLGGLQWDGTPRVEAFALTYLGAEDTIYHRNIGGGAHSEPRVPGRSHAHHRGTPGRRQILRGAALIRAVV